MTFRDFRYALLSQLECYMNHILMPLFLVCSCITIQAKTINDLPSKSSYFTTSTSNSPNLMINDSKKYFLKTEHKLSLYTNDLMGMHLHGNFTKQEEEQIKNYWTQTGGIAVYNLMLSSKLDSFMIRKNNTSLSFSKQGVIQKLVIKKGNELLIKITGRLDFRALTRLLKDISQDQSLEPSLSRLVSIAGSVNYFFIQNITKHLVSTFSDGLYTSEKRTFIVYDYQIKHIQFLGYSFPLDAYLIGLKAVFTEKN